MELENKTITPVCKTCNGDGYIQWGTGVADKYGHEEIACEPCSDCELRESGKPDTVALPRDVVNGLIAIAKEATWQRNAWTDEHGVRRNDPSSLSIKANKILERYEAALKDGGV